MLESMPTLSVARQLRVWDRVEAIREQQLDLALRRAVAAVAVQQIDAELAAQADASGLQKLAVHGLRGEVFYAVPCLLTHMPTLLGYYRMLLGISQKAFYRHPLVSGFKSMEERGALGPKQIERLADLVGMLNDAASALVDGLPTLSSLQVHELQLMTLGAALVGSENNRIGRSAIEQVFDLIDTLVLAETKATSPGMIRFTNASGRQVEIAFASDPDIVISEVLPSGRQPTVSIEIKGGIDRSNQHNRLGEAEKSHQKAKQRGCFEFWTICRVALDEALAHAESPTTSRFFSLDAITDPSRPEHAEFRHMVRYKTGLPDD